MQIKEDAIKMKNEKNMKNTNYIYRKNYFLIDETTYVQNVSLAIEAIEINDEKVDRTMDISVSDMAELPLDQLEEEDKRKLEVLNEFSEVYVMPKGVYENLLDEPGIDLFHLSTQYMILMN